MKKLKWKKVDEDNFSLEADIVKGYAYRNWNDGYWYVDIDNNGKVREYRRKFKTLEECKHHAEYRVLCCLDDILSKLDNLMSQLEGGLYDTVLV